jgi:opine dehydrogenase
MTTPRFAFFGMGNLGLAHSAHMALHGYDVSLCTRTGAKLQSVMDNDNTVSLAGVVSGKARLSLVTEDYEEAIAGRDVIVLCTAAPGHVDTITRLLPFLKPHHHIVLHPGYMLGAVQIHQLLTKHGMGDMAVSEFESSLFTCRYDGKTVNVNAIKKRLGCATLPAHRTGECLSLFSPLYSPYLQAYGNVMETSLLNLNFIYHLPITLLNAAATERGHRFLYYKEGVTQEVAHLIESIDNERMAVCDALGVSTNSAHEWQTRHYTALIKDSTSLYSTMTTNNAYNGIYAPDSLYTRYIWEDVPYGIMPVISLGAAVGVKTPALEAIYALCKAMFRKDWRKEARTLKNLELTCEQLLQLIKQRKIA